jgi:peptide-methionine (S)-S-oxide reductase
VVKKMKRFCWIVLLIPLLWAAPAGGAGRQAEAIFSGGCFWCMEPPFEKLQGVSAVISGYTGGHKKNPSYDEVSYGSTGHAEAVRILYNPEQISYAELVKIFWHTIDPTQANGQFCDHGDQYRTAIFYRNEEEKRLAEESKKEVEKQLKRPVVTQIVAATEFYVAEDYHQDFYKKSSVRYNMYRMGCGRDRRLRELWGDSAAH